MDSRHGVPTWQHFIFLSLRNSHLQLPCTWDCGRALELPRNISTRLCWNCCIPLGLVQVQTPEEPEPDLNLSSLLLRFRFAKFRELDLKLGFRFCPRTGPNRTAATLFGGHVSHDASGDRDTAVSFLPTLLRCGVFDHTLSRFY